MANARWYVQTRASIEWSALTDTDKFNPDEMWKIEQRVNNHPFSDGNKRCAAALFVYFLNGNGILGETPCLWRAQQLIVSNPSTNPTTVDIAVWGSETAGKMALSTQSTLSVPAEGES